MKNFNLFVEKLLLSQTQALDLAIAIFKLKSFFFFLWL